MNEPIDERVKAAVHRASEELELAEHYEASVRPLVRDREGRWPRCCDSCCEPCSRQLNRVAARALELLGTPRVAPLPE
jgi:hypothetical protein